MLGERNHSKQSFSRSSFCQNQTSRHTCFCMYSWESLISELCILMSWDLQMWQRGWGWHQMMFCSQRRVVCVTQAGNVSRDIGWCLYPGAIITCHAACHALVTLRDRGPAAATLIPSPARDKSTEIFYLPNYFRLWSAAALFKCYSLILELQFREKKDLSSPWIPVIPTKVTCWTYVQSEWGERVICIFVSVSRHVTRVNTELLTM